MLLVLADEGRRETLADFLAAANYDVHAVGPPADGLKRVEGTEFVATVTDLYASGTSGVHLAREIERRSPDTEVILLADISCDCARGKCAAAGALAVLERPFNPALLVDLLAQAASVGRRRRLSRASEYLPGDPPPGPHRALVIEVDDDLRALLLEVISGHGLEAETAAHADEGLERLAGEFFELVSTDLWTGQSYAADALHQIRHVEPDAELIVVSGTADPEILAEARRSGAAACLTKPFKLAQVRESLDALDLDAVNLRRQQREAERRARLKDPQ